MSKNDISVQWDRITDQINATEGEIKPIERETPAEAINPLITPLWSVDERFLDPSTEFNAVPVWGMMGDRRAVPRQGIITFSAKRKQGKSTAIYALLTSIMTGREFDTFKPTGDRPRLCIVFDTEMDKPTLATRVKAMHATLGDASRLFCVVPLLETPKSERQQIIEEMTAKYNPDVVVIDQAARLVKDFNASTECIEFGEWLAQYAAARSVFVVIHQNKDKDNEQMKGHLGTIVGELAVENYSVVKSNGVYAVAAIDSRISNFDDAATFKFALDDAGAIIDPANILKDQLAEKQQRWFANFQAIFGDNKEMRHGDLCTAIMSKEGLSNTAARTKIANARELGIIEKTGKGNRDPYKLIAPTSTGGEFDGIEIDDDDFGDFDI